MLIDRPIRHLLVWLTDLVYANGGKVREYAARRKVMCSAWYLACILAAIVVQVGILLFALGGGAVMAVLSPTWRECAAWVVIQLCMWAML